MLQGYAVWSGLVFQMAALVVAGYLAGNGFNRYIYDAEQYAVVAGVLTGVVVAVVFAIRFTLRNQ